MKKFFALLLALTLIVGTVSLSLTSCDTTHHDLADQVKTDVYDMTENLKSDYTESKDDIEFAKKLKKYCDEVGLKAEIVNKGNVIVNLKATKGFEKTQSNIILVEFSKSKYKESCQAIAMAMATAKNSTEHGKLRLIFSPKINNMSVGVKELNTSYFKADNIINLIDWEKTEMFNGSAETKSYDINSSSYKSSPKGTLAYKITIKNLAKTDSGDRTSKHTNPIIFISDLLSSAKSSGLNLEIASFTSKGSLTEYPTAAEAVIVVDQSSETKMENRLEGEKEDFQDKNRKRDPDATFEYAVTKVPSKVLNYDQTSNLLSLLYTLEDGIFATTEEDYEGDILGMSTIASIKLTDNSVNVKVIGRNIDKDTSSNMDVTFKTTANLSDYSCKITNRYPLWKPLENNRIVKENKLKKALESNGIDRKVKYLFKENCCSFVQQKNKNINMISLGVNVEEGKECSMALIDYLKEDIKEK